MRRAVWRGLRRKGSRRRGWPLSALAVRVSDGPGVNGRVTQNSRRHGEAGLVGGVVAAVEYRCVVGTALDDPLARHVTVTIRIAEDARSEERREGKDGRSGGR